MWQKLFGPRHTFKDALITLEKGLRSGEISLSEETDQEIRDQPEYFEGIIHALLYKPGPSGFTEAIRQAEDYLKASP